MDAKVLLYQAYGSPEIIRQTMFSMVSLLKYLPKEDPLQIWVYTDQKAVFENFFSSHPKIHYVEVDNEKIKKWRGKIDFVHRVKIEALIDLGHRARGCLFYCDGDTYFMASPSDLFNRVNPSTSLMHIAENALDQGKDPLSKKILKFVKKHHFQVQNELVGIGPSTVMWNAGVLGIATENKKLLPMILELTDQMHSLYQKHVMEQLAFSFFLQTKTKILPADSVIYHYWDQKPEYQKKIDQFLSLYSNVDKALENWEKFVFPGPPVKKQKKTWIQKLLKKA